MTVKRILKRKEEEKPAKKAKTAYTYRHFVTEEQRSTSLLAIEALIYAVKQSATTHDRFVELKLQLKEPMTEKRVFVPIILNVPNKLRTLTNTKVLLVTQDESHTAVLEKTNSFDEVTSFKKFSLILRDSKKAKDLYTKFDVIMLDYRQRVKVPKLIRGTVLNKSNRRLPLLVQVEKQNEEFDVEHVLKQAQSLCKNTSYVPATGKSISIVISRAEVSSELILENLDAILAQLKNKTQIEKMFLVCGETTLPILEE